MIYRWVIRPIIFRLEPELAHHLTIAILKIVQRWIEFKWVVLVIFAVAAQEVSRVSRTCFMCLGSKWKTHVRLGYVRCTYCEEKTDEGSHVCDRIHDGSSSCVHHDHPDRPIGSDVGGRNVVSVDPALDAGGPRGDQTYRLDHVVRVP